MEMFSVTFSLSYNFFELVSIAGEAGKIIIDIYG